MSFSSRGLEPGVSLRVSLFLSVVATTPALAQDPPPRDSVAADSLAPADSSSTDRLLAVAGQGRVLLNPLPLSGVGGLLPAGFRRVFTRDSIDWMPAHTVSELLVSVPGVFLWRQEWQGRAEMPSLHARGAGAIEYVVDGVPVLAVGPDSVAIDPSLFSLDLLERVEVERGAGALRVSLFTRRHDRLSPRTKIGISTGDRALARYSGSFERRYPSGIGLSLAGDVFTVDAPGNGTGGAGLTNGWAQLSWQLSPRLGTQIQYMVQRADRDPLLPTELPSPVDTLDAGLNGTRSDAQFRVSWRGSDGPTGISADGFLSRTTWTGEGVRHDIATTGAVVAYRQPTWSAESRVFNHTAWTPLDVRLAAGWSPFTALSAAIEGVHQKHEGDRKSDWVTARAGFLVPQSTPLLLGIRLPMAFRLGAMVRHGERVDAPALIDESAQSFTDYELSAALERPRMAFEATMTSTDAWHPQPFSRFRLVSGLGPQPRTTWLGLRARVSPTGWFTLSSAYDHPMNGIIPDGQPPHHAWTTATVSSRFLRNFPSGIFRLKVQGIMESWSPGVIGRDAEGLAISMPGLTFFRAVLQLQIGPFIAYWDRVNLNGVVQGHIPGHPIFHMGSSYGIRWEFAN